MKLAQTGALFTVDHSALTSFDTKEFTFRIVRFCKHVYYLLTNQDNFSHYTAHFVFEILIGSSYFK